jgi:hypothetical protein
MIPGHKAMELANEDRKRHDSSSYIREGCPGFRGVQRSSMAQSQPVDQIIEQMEKKGYAVLETKIRVCKYEYSVDGKRLRPSPFVLPTGLFRACCSSRAISTARNYVPLGIRLAKHGFASVAVSQPGFGKSAGPPDFVGPKTIAALTEGYECGCRGAPLSSFRKSSGQRIEHDNRLIGAGNHRFGDGNQLILLAEHPQAGRL